MLLSCCALNGMCQVISGRVPIRRVTHEVDDMWGDTTLGEACPVVASLLTGAESEILLLEPGGDARWPWPLDIAPLVTGAIDRGCHVRVLFGRWPSTATARLFAQQASDAGAELRTGGAPDQTMMAVDDTAALLPADATEITVVTQAHVVRLLRGLGDLAWARAAAARVGAATRAGVATRLGAATRLGTAARGGAADVADQPDGPAHRDADTAYRTLQRRIVQLLADGAKDETIARVTGLSVRTCRRHIADIMRRLDAVSRFQAGANAVRLGLTGAEPAPRR
jgi:DNA-binding CsgD family transcriptional regulator